MEEPSTILSTKMLTESQRELLLNAGIAFVEYDSITTQAIPFKLEEKQVKNVIITSSNAIEAIRSSGIEVKYFFCVGQKTKTLLNQNGYQVKESADNAAALAEIIAKEYQKEVFYFFCGNIRRDELPKTLNTHNIKYKEVVVYETLANLKEFDRVFDGILFFSPSGVKSFLAANYIEDSVAFCIGNTTGDEVTTYTDNVIIANRPTVENVIVQAIKYF